MIQRHDDVVHCIIKVKKCSTKHPCSGSHDPDTVSGPFLCVHFWPFSCVYFTTKWHCALGSIGRIMSYWNRLHDQVDVQVRGTFGGDYSPSTYNVGGNFFLLYSKWLVQMARDLRNSHWTALHIFKFAWLYRCRGLQVWPRHSWCVVCVCDAICNADIWGGRQIWQRLMPRALLPHFEPLPILLKTLDFAAYFECVNSNALIWL